MKQLVIQARHGPWEASTEPRECTKIPAPEPRVEASLARAFRIVKESTKVFSHEFVEFALGSFISIMGPDVKRASKMTSNAEVP
jgi:hypothetical protein